MLRSVKWFLTNVFFFCINNINIIEDYGTTKEFIWTKRQAGQ